MLERALLAADVVTSGQDEEQTGGLGRNTGGVRCRDQSDASSVEPDLPRSARAGPPDPGERAALVPTAGPVATVHGGRATGCHGTRGWPLRGAVSLAWGRCPDDATEVDHVYR